MSVHAHVHFQVVDKLIERNSEIQTLADTGECAQQLSISTTLLLKNEFQHVW